MDESLFSVMEKSRVGIFRWGNEEKWYRDSSFFRVGMTLSSIHAFEVALLISIKPPEGPRIGRYYGGGLEVHTAQALLSFHWLGLSHVVTLNCKGSWETRSVTPGREGSRLGEHLASPHGYPLLTADSGLLVSCSCAHSTVESASHFTVAPKKSLKKFFLLQKLYLFIK